MPQYRRLQWFVLILVGLSLSVAVPVQSQDTSPLERGVHWFNHRAEGSTGTVAAPGPINKAIESLQIALNEGDNQRKAAEYLLFSYYIKGTHLNLTSDRKQSILSNGKQLGERMVEQYPKSPPIIYGYLINLGRWAEVYGLVSAAREGVAGTMRKYSRKIVEIDPDYRQAAGYRLLGIVYHQTPYIPFVLGWPSNQKALDYLNKALEIAPDHPGNNYFYAKVLNAVGRTQESLRYLDKVLAMEPREGFLLEDRRIMKQARELKRTITG
jgi:tetratricopeptide (TPR) repeat protein